MSTDFLDRDAAAELFVQMLTIVAYDGAIEDITSILENGPPGRGPAQDRIALHQWFQSLDENTKAYVAQVIRETADAAVFHALVLLDGMTGGYPLRPRLSDFALYLRAYENHRAQDADRPEASVRLNPKGTAVLDLHDIFRGMVDDREKNRT